MDSKVVFPLQPIDRFGGKSAIIKRPEEVTYFSYDENRCFHWDDRSMQYYYPPELPADLNAGYENFKRWDDSIDEHLDGLLKAIMLLEQKTGYMIKSTFITWRGMVTKIMSAPFDKFNSWVYHSHPFWQPDQLIKSALRCLLLFSSFIEEHHAARFVEKQEQNNRPPKGNGPTQDMMAYWGYKFESLALIPDIWDNVSREFIESRGEHVVDNIQQYCSVVTTKIGDSDLILGGEVDAVWDRKPVDPAEPINWVELKTSEEIQSEYDQEKFERKLLKFWIQSFLLGVPKIIVGFRSKYGQLLRLQEMSTQSIPGFVKRSKASWNGSICINFATAFLDYLRQTITTEGTWRISRRKGSPVVEIFKVEEHGTGRIISPEFLQWRQQLMAQKVAEMLK